MSDQLIVYSICLVILLLSGFGTLYWRAKFAKDNLLDELEAQKKTKEAVEKAWFWPLFVVLIALSSVTIGQDVLVLIPGFSTSRWFHLSNSLPLLKYILALGLGTITFIDEIIRRRALKDPQS